MTHVGAFTFYLIKLVVLYNLGMNHIYIYFIKKKEKKNILNIRKILDYIF